jgi:UDPglucose--hexose-1-phosphate uridylyltransferase
MSQLRLNPLAGRWVTISSVRAKRPFAFDDQPLAVEPQPVTPCPFCPGNEEATPPALETYGSSGGWLVRVVPNRFPAFGGREPLAATHLGPVFTQAPATGIHEVLVFTPDHEASWADLDEGQTGLVMAAIRARVAAHATVPAVRYTQVVVNHGRAAGASIAHPHGQLLGVPFVPKELSDEEAGFERFVGGCLMCTILEAEIDAGYRVVAEDDLAVVVCPYWSGAPYEMLVIPRRHEGHLDQARADDLFGTAMAIGSSLSRVRTLLGDVPYNVVFHSSPHRHRGNFHWHAHIIPKLISREGFELGTGVLINVVPPEMAADQLREVGVSAPHAPTPAIA